MGTYVGLLRAVNLPRHGKVTMEALRALAAGLGLEQSRTLLQSGNLVFEASRATAASLEKRLEDACAAELGLTTDIFVRSVPEVADIVASNPFPEAAATTPGHLVVIFHRKALEAEAVAALQAAITGPEQVRADGRHLYAVYPAGIGDSRLTADVLARALGSRGTGRNWNTVGKLLSSMSGASGSATRGGPRGARRDAS